MYYDLQATAKAFDVQPIIFCVPSENSRTYTSGTRVWNFASECRPVGVIDLVPTLADINVADLKVILRKGKRRCWLRLGVNIGVDVTVTVSWKYNGQRFKDKDDEEGSFSAMLALKNLDLPDKTLVNEFRAPIEQQHSSDHTILDDTLPPYLEKLRATSRSQELAQEICEKSASFLSSKCCRS